MTTLTQTFTNPKKIFFFGFLILLALLVLAIGQVMLAQTSQPAPSFDPKGGTIEKAVAGGVAVLTWKATANGCDFSIKFEGEMNSEFHDDLWNRPCNVQEILKSLKDYEQMAKIMIEIPKWMKVALHELIVALSALG